MKFTRIAFGFIGMVAFALSGAPKFTMELETPAKNTFKTGERIEFKIKVTHPENYKFYNWYVAASAKNVPIGFNAWKKPNSPMLVDIQWIEKASPEKNEVTAFIKTDKYPAGDYSVSVVSRCEAMKKGMNPPLKLQSQRFDFTIVDPSSKGDTAKNVETVTTKSGKFSMTVTRSKQWIFKIGDRIPFELSVTHPGKYKFYNWHAVAAATSVPEGFKSWKKGTRIVHDLQWIPNASPEKTKIRAYIDTTGFPAGDYNFGIVPRLDAVEKGLKPAIKLQSQRFSFTLEDPKAAPAPEVDGKGNDPAWKNVPWTGDFKKLGTTQKAEVQTRYKYWSDGKVLYFLIECSEPSMDKVKAFPAAKNSGGLWQNDSVELKVCSDETLSHFYKVVVDINGQYGGRKYIDKNTSDRSFTPVDFWDAFAKTAVQRGTDRWTLEVALPIGAFDISAKNTQNWRIDVGRNRYAGKTEISSGGSYSKGDHTIVTEYPKIVLKSFQPTPFLIKLDSIRNQIVQAANGDVVCITKGNIFNERKQGCNLKIRTYFTDKAGNIKGENTQFCAVYAGTPVNVTLKTASKTPGKYTYHIEFWSNETEPKLLKNYSMPLEVYYSPFKSELISPCYRNNIYATMPDKTIEVRVAVTKNIGKELTFELVDSNEKVVVQKKIASAKANNSFVYDAKNLPDGRYTLRISMMESGHKFVEKIKLRKLPYQEGEVWIDKNGATHVDGKPFIPLGWYIVERSRTLGPAENVVINHSFFAKDLKTFHHYLDTIWASKRKMIIKPFQTFDGTGEEDPKRPRPFARPQQVKSLTKEQIDYIKKNVAIMSKHPGILAWYLSDEPESSVVTPEWLSQARDLLAEVDPYHPTTVTNFSEEGMRKFANCCDIIFPDCYPGYFEKIHSYQALATTKRGKTANDLKKPSWLILPGTLFPTVLNSDKSIKGIPPGYEDILRQTYEAIIQNMMGFTFFASMDGLRYSSLIVGLPAMCSQVEALKYYIITKTLAVKADVSPSDKDFVCGMKQLGKEFAVFAANGCAKEQTVTYTLPVKFNGTLYNAGAAKSFTVKNGKFTDKIPGWRNQLYLTDRKLAQSLESTQSVEKRIAAHYNGRKRPGNLLAVGELLLADMVAYNLTPEKRPKTITDVKASSYSPHYYTSYAPSRNTGPLYFTVDGIRLPTRVEFCWRPRGNDKNPYLLYTIPKASPVKEARIYTPYGNLRKGIVVTDTKQSPFDNSQKKSEEIIVKLSGETTKTLKIMVTDYTWTDHDSQLGTNSCSGVVSEVELY